ncbi:hypothetical protein [Flavivirga spongiicola]|uniref:DKNYY family protein n=1 Tax=Flavivirga spongiicola TaxID=421621 RepID=A0ABU7XMV3_9FLAO|nr:hypothetical protein [Flavivirga sp. MEBiC05379]MDO5981751.1 hypothetical protein [Flavivirga sp. MEBiC05379]
MMKNLLTIFILTFTIIACKQNSTELKRNETIEYYPNNPKVIFKKIVHLMDSDSVYYFYDNGILFKKGKQYKENQKFGNWELYDRDSDLREIREWFTLNGKSRANRAWNLNKKGDTIAWRTQDSIYKQAEFINDTIPFRNTIYDIVFFNRDTIKLNEPIRGYVEVFSSVIRDQPSHVRAFIAKDSANYNYDFSNEKEVKFAEFNDLSIDSINQKWFKGADFNKLAVIGLYFDTVGEKYLRGYYQQYSFGPFSKDESGQKIDSIIGHKIYFEKKIYVIDSIEQNHSVQHSI